MYNSQNTLFIKTYIVHIPHFFIYICHSIPLVNQSYIFSLYFLDSKYTLDASTSFSNLWPVYFASSTKQCTNTLSHHFIHQYTHLSSLQDTNVTTSQHKDATKLILSPFNKKEKTKSLTIRIKEKSFKTHIDTGKKYLEHKSVHISRIQSEKRSKLLSSL